MKTKSITYLSLTLFMLLLLNSNCKNVDSENSEPTQNASTNNAVITSKDIQSIKYTEYVLSDLAKKKTEDWSKSQTLNELIEKFKLGDLSFFTNDKTILKAFIDDLINEVPETLASSSILVRLSVLKTNLFKLEESARLDKVTKEQLLINIADLLISHSNLIYQINKKVEKESQIISN